MTMGSLACLFVVGAAIFGFGANIAFPSNVVSPSCVVQPFRFARAGTLFRKAGLAAASQDSSSRRSVWDGVYTDDQAKRGETQYGRNCEACHGVDLAGNPVQEVPSLVYEAFLTQWNGRTVKDLFDAIKRSMPRDNPGGLNARAYVDVTAYLLQANRFPSGMKDLSLNPDALGQIVIENEKK